MRRIIFLLLLGVSLTSTQADCSPEIYEQYDGNGIYQGQMERKSDSKFESYDKNGYYQGEVKENSDGKSYDYFDANGCYKGTIKRK